MKNANRFFVCKGKSVAKMSEIAGNNKKIAQLDSKITKGLNKKSQINQGVKLGRKAKANLKQNAGSRNVPLVEKAFSELKITEKIDGVGNPILEKKLDARLSAQKNTFGQKTAHIVQLKDVKGQLTNANTLGAKTVAPVLGTTLENAYSQKEYDISGQTHEEDYEEWDNDLFRFSTLIEKQIMI